ncbi:hypothetical protein Q427_20895 [Halomonas sp. BC04]|nr:hypothetical protein Q427_20895 [Halomonas sp. BC04]
MEQHRTPEPCLHQSVRQRWDDPHIIDKSPALKQQLDSVAGDWTKVEVMA